MGGSSCLADAVVHLRKRSLGSRIGAASRWNFRSILSGQMDGMSTRFRFAGIDRVYFLATLPPAANEPEMGFVKAKNCPDKSHCPDEGPLRGETINADS